MCVFSTFALEFEDKQGRERWKGRSNNAHVSELRCVITRNFRFSNRYQSEEHEMASFNV